MRRMLTCLVRGSISVPADLLSERFGLDPTSKYGDLHAVGWGEGP